MITGQTTGVIENKVNELMLNEKFVDIVNKGDVFTTHINEIIRPNDKLFKVINID